MYTELLKKIWADVYNPQMDAEEAIKKYFHPNYEQSINGVNMKRAEYIQHVLDQRKNMSIDIIDYKHVLEKDQELFAIYYPKGKNADNYPIEAEVIAYFRFENQQIVRIQGAVRLIRGNLTDVDM